MTAITNYTSPEADRYLLRGKAHESGIIELEEWASYEGNGKWRPLPGLVVECTIGLQYGDGFWTVSVDPEDMPGYIERIDEYVNSQE